MKGVVLFIVSVILTAVVGTIGLAAIIVVGIVQVLFDYRQVDFGGVGLYFERLAISIDIFGASLLYPVWNEILIKNASIHPFGRPGETISDNLGDNKKVINLTKTGLFLCNVLNALEKDHVEIASNKDRND